MEPFKIIAIVQHFWTTVLIEIVAQWPIGRQKREFCDIFSHISEVPNFCLFFRNCVSSCLNHSNWTVLCLLFNSIERAFLFCAAYRTHHLIYCYLFHNQVCWIFVLDKRTIQIMRSIHAPVYSKRVVHCAQRNHSFRQRLKWTSAVAFEMLMVLVSASLATKMVRLNLVNSHGPWPFSSKRKHWMAKF